jgi:GNAT superfamily N-acetyltransferase
MRHARRADLAVIRDVWVDAFSADPYLRWLAPDDAQWSAFGAAWMTFVVELTFERGHTYVAEPADVAAAWIPPDLSFAGPGDVARGRGIIEEHCGAARAEQALASIIAARSHDLDEPHWTLQYIGVRSAKRGAGLGAVAAESILEVCDADGLPCSLVSTNLRNVTFYERLGFEVAAEVSTADGQATLRPMHRRPR